MAEFTPSYPYNVPAELLIPENKTVKGVLKKVYPETGKHFNCSFKTYGGTELNKNDTYVVLDTATVETWYRPDITSDYRIKLCQTGTSYEIIGEPENINMRNQYMKFKVQRVKGGA